MMVLGIVYFALAGALLFAVCKWFSYSDKYDYEKKSSEYWFKEYCNLKKENDENVQIIERIKENLPF